MGGASFDVEIRGEGLSMQDAYNQAVQEALYESGHNPYNGTISTTSGVIVAPDLPKREPLTFEEASAHLQHQDESGEWVCWWDREPSPRKWDAAWAIPLAAGPPPENPTGWEPDRTKPGWLFYGIAAC
jgi:hypothetical protein